MSVIAMFVVSALVGFVYIFTSTHYLSPQLYLKGKRLHHNSRGTIMGYLIFAPLTFYIVFVNFAPINIREIINLITSILGLGAGTAFEHFVIHNKKEKRGFK